MEISRGEGKRSLRYKKEDEEVGSEVGLREEEEDDDDDDGRKKRVISTGTDLHSKRWSKGGGSSSSCQVDGCDSDLSAAKPYHRRHKVCEYHAKYSSVLISGMHQRFCQQCSRFHEVSEFDESKRSCRRRLAGHNERRRKIASD